MAIYEYTMHERLIAVGISLTDRIPTQRDTQQGEFPVGGVECLMHQS